MARTPRGHGGIDDAEAYPKQRGRSIYGRNLAEALMHVYSYRGRVLVPAADMSGGRAVPLPAVGAATDNYVTVGDWLTQRTDTARPIRVSVTLAVGNNAVGYAAVDGIIDGKLTASEYDGTTDAETHTLDTLTVRAAPIPELGFFDLGDASLAMRSRVEQGASAALVEWRVAPTSSVSEEMRVKLELRNTAPAAATYDPHVLAVTIFEEPIPFTSA